MHYFEDIINHLFCATIRIIMNNMHVTCHVIMVINSQVQSLADIF